MADPRIGALQKTCPQVDLRFQLIPGPLKGPLDTVDFGMRYLAPGDTGFDMTFFVNEVVVPVCSPAYRERRAAAGKATFIHLDGSPTDWIARLHASAADAPTSCCISPMTPWCCRPPCSARASRWAGSTSSPTR